jgi:hypothetical protein
MFFDYVFFITVLVSMIAMLLMFYLESNAYKTILAFCLCLSLLETLAMHFWKEKILLHYFAPKYSRNLAIFRFHHRRFKSEYIPKTHNPKYKWPRADCLLCRQEALIVNVPCHHLALCPTCHAKMLKKQFRSCLLCSGTIANSREIVIQPVFEKYGFSEQSFIEKKLYPNQYLLK